MMAVNFNIDWNFVLGTYAVQIRTCLLSGISDKNSIRMTIRNRFMFILDENLFAYRNFWPKMQYRWPLEMDSCLFYLSFNFDFCVSKICTYELGIFHANRITKCLKNQRRNKGKGWSTTNQLKPSSNVIAGRLKAALLLWFFGGFRCGVWLFLVIFVRYKKKKIGRNIYLMLG